MVYALQKFRHYLFGGHFKTYTDHSVLKYLVNKPALKEHVDAAQHKESVLKAQLNS